MVWDQGQWDLAGQWVPVGQWDPAGQWGLEDKWDQDWVQADRWGLA